MAETVFEHLDGKSTFTISTDERHWKATLAKLAERNAETELVAQNRDGAVMYRVPASWVRVRPPAKRPLTEEQRAAFTERMRQSRS